MDCCNKIFLRPLHGIPPKGFATSHLQMLKVKVGFKSSASGAILEQPYYEAGVVECGGVTAAFPAPA
jgi:hypothetical protein